MKLMKTILAAGSLIGASRAASVLRALSVDDVLGSVGLERRGSAFGRSTTALGLIGLGAVVGAGVALMLAPSSGEQLRGRLSDGLDRAKEKLNRGVERLEGHFEHAELGNASNANRVRS